MKIGDIHFFPKIRKHNRKHYVQMKQIRANWYVMMHGVKRIFPGVWKETGKMMTQSIFGGKPI